MTETQCLVLHYIGLSREVRHLGGGVTTGVSGLRESASYKKWVGLGEKLVT